jgi:hypothetical protein
VLLRQHRPRLLDKLNLQDPLQALLLPAIRLPVDIRDIRLSLVSLASLNPVSRRPVIRAILLPELILATRHSRGSRRLACRL